MLVNMFWLAGNVEDSLKVAREIRMLEREFGLTPLSRRRLEWNVVQAEDAIDKHNSRRRKSAAVISGDDPREVLQ
jgi:hypothetical protein